MTKKTYKEPLLKEVIDRTLKDKTPEPESMKRLSASVPLIKYSSTSPSASLPEIVPTADVFSSIVKSVTEVRTGELSFRLLTAIVIS